jgi:hypothetical protein
MQTLEGETTKRKRKKKHKQIQNDTRMDVVPELTVYLRTFIFPHYDRRHGLISLLMNNYMYTLCSHAGDYRKAIICRADWKQIR